MVGDFNGTAGPVSYRERWPGADIQCRGCGRIGLTPWTWLYVRTGDAEGAKRENVRS